MSQQDGMNYAPQGKPAPVCQKGEFKIAAVHLDHGHIFGQCNGLIEAGAELAWVYDPDPEKVASFCKQYPGVKSAPNLETILNDPTIQLVTAAAITNRRGPLGCRVMEAGKDYFTDKAPFTTLAQLADAREVTAKTGKKFMVYYSERLHVECAILAGQLIESGAIGRVIQTLGLGPHRLTPTSRPDWFFKHEEYGGILCDIGSHQCEQFLYYTGAKDAQVNYSAVANYNHPDYPELEDFGEVSLTADNGASGYMRVDWFTPDGSKVWGDGRTVILGTEGYMELRKYTNLGAEDSTGNQLFIVDQKGQQTISCDGKVGYPFFGQLILDCLNRTETAMTQAHAFKSAELCLNAQAAAVKLA